MELVYTAKPADTGPLGRGIGTYALGQPTTGAGIRTQRYSTDPAINTWTYASVSGMAIPHGVGSVWAQAAWDMYWALVDAHGFSSDLYAGTGTAGNQRAMLYVNEGLMNTSCSPAFTDVRDGIIQAATDNHGGADVCLLWSTFAAFGLGTDAVSGGNSGTSPTNGFSVPVSCLANAPSLSVDDVQVTEGDTGTTSATFTVTQSASSNLTVSVDYATANGTAEASVGTVTQANTSAITLPASGTSGSAGPYPSTIVVPTSSPGLTDVTLTLTGLGHTYPGDLSMLLVGPQGQSVILMSRIGGGTDAVNATITFDDDGPAMSTPIVSGTFRPTNLGAGVFPGPAPAGPYGTSMSVFDATDPSGTWSLYITGYMALRQRQHLGGMEPHAGSTGRDG